MSTKEVYEVTGMSGTFAVNAIQKSCSCNEWDMTGIPCVHACAGLLQDNKNPYTYVDNYYSVEAYKKAYEGVIMPMPNQANWVKTNSDPLLPPHRKIAPGRPKKVRRKAPLEDLHVGKLSKIGLPIHCSHCGHIDHNARSCKVTGCLFVRQTKSRHAQVEESTK